MYFSGAGGILMPGKYQSRTLISFQKEFPDDESCLQHLALQKWRNGFICPRCGHKAAWTLPERGLFDCKKCRYQSSVTAGTIFHKTRVPLLKWYWLIYHMAMDKVGVSVAEMQRILGIGQYRTAWLMAHKIRKAMAERDSQYSLAGLVEMDESFFGPAGTTHGRGSEHKCLVLCAVSIYKDKMGDEKPGFAHMRIVDDASADTIENFLERLGCGRTTEEGRQLMETIRSDGWRSYGKAATNKGLSHCKVVLRDPTSAGKLLPWIHRVIANTKNVIRGTHRGVSGKHLQSYLSEISYRFNRRFWEAELFDRLIQACVSAETVTYSNLTKRIRS
jgi:transposase-like protein